MLRSLVGSEMCIRDSLPYCDNFVEASRVSAQYINEAFTGLTIRTTLDIRGIQLKPQQLVRVTSDRYSFAQKLFQVKEIDELQEGSVLSYRVLLREYEPSNYTDDGTIQEEDPAPNIDFTEPSQIQAVTDLQLLMLMRVLKHLTSLYHGLFLLCLLYTSPSPRDS